MRYVSNIRSNFTLNSKAGSQSVTLLPGESVELPEDNAHVRSLAAQGLIEAAPVEVELVADQAPSIEVAAPAKVGRGRKSKSNI